jgi:sugar phosphate isomerase/epimerase
VKFSLNHADTEPEGTFLPPTSLAQRITNTGWRLGASVKQAARLRTYANRFPFLEIARDRPDMRELGQDEILERTAQYRDRVTALHLRYTSWEHAIEDVALIDGIGAEIGIVHPHYPRSEIEFQKQLGQMAEKCETLGVNVAIENLSDRNGRCGAFEGAIKPASIAQLLDRLGSPRLGLCLDTSHSLMNSVDSWSSRSISKQLLHVHLADNEFGRKSHKHLPISHETGFMDPLLELLSASSHKGTVILENTTLEEASESYRYLQLMAQAKEEAI